jgi:4-hydroxy-2-oxoglutarate aldolase
MTNKDRLSGVFVPVVTPFASEALRPEFLRSNLQSLGSSSVAGYLALGSNGEFRSLSEAEQDRVLEVFSEVRGDKVVMVGTSGESAVETIRRTKRVASMGFAYASVLPPSYFAKQMSDSALSAFFNAVADGATIPIVLYNAPQFANGVQIKAGVIAELAGHPNIVGVKDSSKPGPGALLAALDPDVDFAVLAGSTNFFYPSLHLGAVGGVLSLANALPEACSELYSRFRAGDFSGAHALHRRLVQLNQAVSGKHGVAGVKAATTVAGMQGGEPRLPLSPLSPAEYSALERALRESTLL